MESVEVGDEEPGLSYGGYDITIEMETRSRPHERPPGCQGPSHQVRSPHRLEKEQVAIVGCEPEEGGQEPRQVLDQRHPDERHGRVVGLHIEVDQGLDSGIEAADPRPLVTVVSLPRGDEEIDIDLAIRVEMVGPAP